LSAPVNLTPDQRRAARRVDALDLSPVAFRLRHPYPGLTVMSRPEARRAVEAYRRWLKPCAWYPGEPVVPSLAIDDAWHAHMSDTDRYQRDCLAAFGRFAHCRPDFGPDGDGKQARAAYQRTRALFRAHFGTDMPATPDPAPGHPGGDACCTGGAGRIRVFADTAGPSR
jgi:hypothetical protein